MTTEFKSALIIRNIPVDVHRAFKAKCAMEGISQQDKVIELIENYLKGGQGK